MAVLKRFSYDNIVEHNPTAPDPVQGGGGSLNIEQVSYYNSESKTIPAGGIENVELQALYPLPFERFYTCLNYFDIRSIGSTSQVSIMQIINFGSTVYVSIKNLSDSALTIGVGTMNLSYLLLSYDTPQ